MVKGIKERGKKEKGRKEGRKEWNEEGREGGWEWKGLEEVEIGIGREKEKEWMFY